MGDDPSLPMGFRPDRSSRRTTPKAYTSTLSVTFPYMKYSGARYLHRIQGKNINWWFGDEPQNTGYNTTPPRNRLGGRRYPNVPTTSLCVREVGFVGAQMASPKSDSCRNGEFRVQVQTKSFATTRIRAVRVWWCVSVCNYLRLELFREEDVGRLDVPVDHRPRAAGVQVAQGLRDPQRRPVPVLP